MELYFWLIVAVVAFVIEMATPSALVSIWFVVGAVFAAIVSTWNLGAIIEISVFILMSILSFAVFRPLVMKWIKVKNIGSNADRLIGYRGRLAVAITSETWGTLVISGLSYSVSTPTQEDLAKDTWVKVVGLKGARLIVEKDEKGEN